MADTLNFGPEWLRALSDGNSVGTPPPSPGIPGKYKLAEYRYGREELLALSNTNNIEVPEEVKNFSAIYVEKPLEPISLHNLSEEEQRLMSQSVNSTAVLRMFGRGGPPGVRGRGGPERGRGRGRGRGEGGFLQRGMSAEETGGFGRPPTHSRSDGWEEVGSKRNYQSRYDDGTAPQRQFHRSLSNENWRDRTGEEEEDDGDWRKAGKSWNPRTNWREPINRVERGGFDSDRHQPNGIQRGGFDRDKGRSYQRNRISESWDEDDNLPEWSMPDNEGDDVGTFDASGAFVSTKKKSSEKDTENKENRDSNKPKEDEKESDKNKSSDKVKVDTKEKVENKDKAKTPPPHVKKVEKQKDIESKKDKNESKKPVNTEKTVAPVKPMVSKPPAKTNEVKALQDNNSANNNSTNQEPEKNVVTNVSVKKDAAEAETLRRLQEAAENAVLSAMTAEDEDKPVGPQPAKDSTALPVEHENAHKWFYKDPQGDMQGPFTSSEMAEWFSAGYFTMNLQVKRGCDEKISPLGELIKSWGRVPFLPGPSPPPALNTPTSQPDQQEQMKAMQQLLVQQQLMQQQFLMRQLQMQQIQQLMTQLQDNEQFQSLSPIQQQQLAMQIMMKQSPVPVVSQSQVTKLSPRSPPTESVSPSNPSHPAFQQSVSQPNTEEGASIWDTNNTKPNMPGGWSQPTSVWDIDPKVAISNTELEMQLEKARKEKEEQLERIRLEKEEEERRIQEEMKRQQEEIMKQQEELRRQKEEMERQKMEIEKQRQLELQRLEEIRRKSQEEEERKRREAEEIERQRREEEMRKEEERRQKEEVLQRKREDEMRREEELRQQQQLHQQQRQMIEQKQREMEERQKQELQRRQEEARQQQERQRQQQEALKKLQQEQMANMQLPQHAQWANQQAAAAAEQQKAKSLLEIQEQEERERQRQEEVQRQLEAQRQQMLALQQQQQQQKSWSSQIFPSQPSSKSLIEIQEEQARQLELDRQRKQQQQQNQTKNMSISAASAWSGSTSSSHWASEGAWGNQARNIGNETGSLGFWDSAIISSKRAAPPNNKNMQQQQGNPGEFPALKGGNSLNTPSVPVSKTQKPSKLKKEEEAVQRLFKQPQPQQNDFSLWCEKALKSLDTSVDIPTFVAFLMEVDSPYEVHDYVRSYLGESKASKDFAKQFLEKRSQSRNKAKAPAVEESIWGPAPARDYRQSTNQTNDSDFQKGKAGKKKKKMMKLDSSILGFTVSADPERKNVGELDEDIK